jgi:hypothetical protein
MIEMIKRQQVAQAAVDRFKGEPLIFGKNDCARMAAFVLRKFGHSPKMARAGTYSNAIGAVRALQRSGHASLEAWIDSLGLERIAPAAALPGDLVLLPAAEPFGGGLTIAVGNGRVLGYHDDLDAAEVLHPVVYVTAWRL